MTIPGRPGKRGHGGLPSVHHALLALFCWTAVMVQFAVGDVSPVGVHKFLQICKVLRIFNPSTSDQFSIRHVDPLSIIDPFICPETRIELLGLDMDVISGHVVHHDGKLGQALSREDMKYLFDFLHWDVHPSHTLRGWCDCTPHRHFGSNRGYGQELLRVLDGRGKGLLNTLIQHGSGILTEATRLALQEQLVDDRTVMVTMFDVYRTGRIVITFFCRPDDIPWAREESDIWLGEYLDKLSGAVLDFVRIALFDDDTGSEYSFQLTGEAFTRSRYSFPKRLEVKAWEFMSDGNNLKLDSRQFPWEGGQRIFEPSVNGMPLVLPKRRLHLELYNLDNLVHRVTGSVASGPRSRSASSRQLHAQGSVPSGARLQSRSISPIDGRSAGAYLGGFKDDKLYAFLHETKIGKLSSFLARRTLRELQTKGGSIINHKEKEQLGFGPYVAHKLFEVPEPPSKHQLLESKLWLIHTEGKRYSSENVQKGIEKFASEKGKGTVVDIKDVYDNGKIIFTLTLFWESIDLKAGEELKTVLRQYKPNFVFFGRVTFGKVEEGQPGESRQAAQAELTFEMVNVDFWMTIVQTIPLGGKLPAAKLLKQGGRSSTLRSRCDKAFFVKIDNTVKNFNERGDSSSAHSSSSHSDTEFYTKGTNKKIKGLKTKLVKGSADESVVSTL